MVGARPAETTTLTSFGLAPAPGGNHRQQHARVFAVEISGPSGRGPACPPCCIVHAEFRPISRRPKGMNERPGTMGRWFPGPSDIRIGGTRQGIFPQALVLRQFGRPAWVIMAVQWSDLCRTSLDFAPTVGCWAREGGYHRIHAQILSGLCPLGFGRGAVPKNRSVACSPRTWGTWGKLSPGRCSPGDVARKGRRPGPERIAYCRGSPATRVPPTAPSP